MVTVRVVDQCPECAVGDVDLSREAFSEIADLEAGRVPISWKVVSCSIEGPIAYHFKEGSSQWWTAVQIRNHRNPIDRLEVLGSDGAYVELEREDYNYFVAEAGLGTGAYSFRVTDQWGYRLRDAAIALSENGSVDGEANFPECPQR